MIAPEGLMPRRATLSSAGYDFYAPGDIRLEPGKWTEVDTQVRFDGSETVEGCPRWFMLMAPRSGLGFRHGVRLANTVGVIDQDYRQNIRAKLTSDTPCEIPAGKAFMQGIVIPYATFSEEIEPIAERVGGFGSTESRSEATAIPIGCPWCADAQLTASGNPKDGPVTLRCPHCGRSATADTVFGAMLTLADIYKDGTDSGPLEVFVKEAAR